MLSGPHQKFAEGIAAGMDQTAAYQAAYPESKSASARANAARLIANDGIKAEIDAIREAAKEKTGSPVLTLAEKYDILAEVARDTQEKTQDRLRAIEMHAKLSGELSDKVQVSADDDLKSALSAIVDSIRK